jgi:hypothetical protein
LPEWAKRDWRWAEIAECCNYKTRYWGDKELAKANRKTLRILLAAAPRQRNQQRHGETNHMKNAILSLAAMLLSSGITIHVSASAAATHYVSQSSGDGAGDAKTVATAWKTLAKASEATYASGDKILLKCGDTWGNNTLRPKGSGTADHPTVIASYGTGNKPILDGLDDQQDRMGIHLKDVEGYRISGLEFSRYMTGIYAEYSTNAPPRKGLLIEDCYFHDAQLYGHYEDYQDTQLTEDKELAKACRKTLRIPGGKKA